MRLWQSRKTAQLEQEKREAEAARQEARMQKARVRAQAPKVDRMVNALARSRNSDQLTDRIQAAFQRKWASDASLMVGKLHLFTQELTLEADRRQQDRRPDHD